MSGPGHEPSSATGPADDPAIPDVETVCRRLANSSPNMIAVDAVTRTRRPSTAAFKPDADGVSVYRLSLLEQSGLGPADVCVRAGQLVVGLLVADVRRTRLGVRDDPWPPDVEDSGHPRHGAHALITGLEGLTKAERKRRQTALVTAGSLRFLFE